MNRTERRAWEARREQYEERIIERARRAGRLPVIDCTDPKYPVPPAILAELYRANDPDARERAYRTAATLRKKATSLRSLALVMERDAAESGSEFERRRHLARAKDMKAKADAHEHEAERIESEVAA